MSYSDSAPPDSRTRFIDGVQRARLGVYCVSYVAGILAILAGVTELDLLSATALWIVCAASAPLISWAHRRRLDRTVDLMPFWLGLDIVTVSSVIYLSGGIASLWYIWYLVPAAAAAFASGKKAAYIVSAVNTAAYLSLLFAMGQIGGFDQTLYVPLFRMVFLVGASWILLHGVSHITERRLEIQTLQREQSQKVEELTRLSAQLNARTLELASANQKILDADRMKSSFLANMSHELRTPMNSIIGFSEILIQRLEQQVEPKYLNFLNHILVSGRHLLSIINDLLDLSKIEAGKMELFPEKVSVKPVIEGVCHVMRGFSSRQEIRLETDVPDSLPVIETDLAKLKQILYNLLSNAVKFSPPSSTVRIVARHVEAPDSPVGEDALAISVADQGIGISPEDHERVFQEFRQVDGTIGREFGGTGLGLALVKRFAELQGGVVTVESDLGKGSVFRLFLPLNFSPTGELPVAPAQILAMPGEKVLVVEDDPNAYVSISRHLESASYVPVRARHGEEALRLARLIKPVAITLDLVLPGTDGWEVLKQLKNDPETCDIPVVIISIMDNRELGAALGAHDYFLKPVDRSRLIQRIKQITLRPALTEKPRLLLIDDDETFHDFLEDEMNLLGYRVEKALSGELGIELAHKLRPDVIILDLVMPGMNGFQVADALKSRPETAQIPILVMTSKDLTQKDRDDLRHNIAALVPKGQSAKSKLIAAIQQLEQAVHKP